MQLYEGDGERFTNPGLYGAGRALRQPWKHTDHGSVSDLCTTKRFKSQGQRPDLHRFREGFEEMELEFHNHS